MTTWTDLKLKRFVKLALSKGVLYYLKGRGGYAAVECTIPESDCCLPLWLSEEAAAAAIYEEPDWKGFVIRPLPVDDFIYFKDDFSSNGWAVVCFLNNEDSGVEAPFKSVAAAITRENGRRNGRKRSFEQIALSLATPLDPNALAQIEPSELRNAVDSFHRKAKSVGCFGHVSSIESLDAFDSTHPGVMPRWYRELIGKIPICYMSFMASVHFSSEWMPWGVFYDADTLLVETDEMLIEENLMKEGFLPIAPAGDGDWWLIGSSSTFNDPVFHFSQSACSGGGPAGDKDCLSMHSPTFFQFLLDVTPDPNAG